MIHHHLKKSFFSFQAILIIYFLISFVYAAEIGTVYYSGDIWELKDSTIKVPDKAVALPERVKVEFGHDTVVWPLSFSMFFIIDHSGSMCYDNPASTNFPQDQWGKRFVVTQDLIDTLRSVFPHSEIGIVVFREHQYLDTTDSSFFVQHPSYPMGAYMPFFRFDSSYADCGGRPGWLILKTLMESDTVNADDDPMSSASPGYRYRNLVYMPSSYTSNQCNTNINVGFDAAKHAFKSALYPKNRHFIIFFSDGEATAANGPHTDPNAYVAGDSVPATFTIFFTKQGSIPNSIQTMTNNIRQNGYSTSNSKSHAWDISIGQQDLMKFIMDSIITVISPRPPYMPVNIKINGDSTSNYDTLSEHFLFDNLLPFTGVKTDFIYDVTYRIYKDSILPNGDTVVILTDSSMGDSFSVVIDSGVTELPFHYPHDFELISWERELGLYYDNNSLDTICEGMDTVELRFTYDPGDKNYHYTNVAIEVTNTEGASQDKETYTLTKNGYTFSGTFTRAVIEDSDIPVVGDGIFQHYKHDYIAATFRNNEVPKLPLDTVIIKAPYKPSTAIHSTSFFLNGKVKVMLVKTGERRYILKCYNLSDNGKISLFTLNGRKVFNHFIQKGNSHLLLPEILSQAVYFIRLEYGSNVIRKKLIIQ